MGKKSETNLNNRSRISPVGATANSSFIFREKAGDGLCDQRLELYLRPEHSDLIASNFYFSEEPNFHKAKNPLSEKIEEELADLLGTNEKLLRIARHLVLDIQDNVQQAAGSLDKRILGENSGRRDSNPYLKALFSRLVEKSGRQIKECYELLAAISGTDVNAEKRKLSSARRKFKDEMENWFP